MNAREEILGRIRAAVADVAPGEPTAWSPETDPDPAAAYRRDGARVAEAEDVAALFAQRANDYRAHVARCGIDGAAVRAAVQDACTRQGVGSLLVAPGLDDAWVPADLRVTVDDPPRAPAELDACEGVLTTCAVAIALTGTIVLDGRAGQGRRALTLVPDLHICVVPADRIVATVPQAIAAVAPGPGARFGPLTLISGPSATSDIELTRVEGVHGPRRLEIIVAGG